MFSATDFMISLKIKSTLALFIFIFLTAGCANTNGITEPSEAENTDTDAEMNISVRGSGVDINNVGESGYELMYPVATRTGWESEYFHEPGEINLFDERPSAIEGKDFATVHIDSKDYTRFSHTYDESRKDYSLDSFSADKSGTVTIAVPTNSLDAEGWSITPVSFNSTVTTFYLYEYNYSDPGSQVDIPAPNPDFPTLLFAEVGHLAFDNPLPVSELAEGTIIDESDDPYNKGDYTYDPHLMIMPNGDYITGEKNVRYISTDKGKTWTQLNTEDYKIEHASTFNHDGALYIIGDEDDNSEGTGAINRSTDGGKTWETPVMLFENLRNSPSHVIKTKNRIWLAYEHLSDHTVNFASAPVDSDLMDADSWVTTERQDNHGTGNETDMVLGRDGWPIAMPKNGGPKVRVLSAAEAVTEEGKDDFKLPVSGSKYSAIYDPESDKYWALTSYSPIEGNIRTGIGLFSSSDLKTFTLEKQVIQGKSTGFHGFNYPFMQIDGDDIVFVSRTAWENENGQAQRWHDANMFTFHRIRDFRDS
jgi:hypothetical protein